MDVLEAVKSAIRARGTDIYDDEIRGLILSAEMEMRVAGVRDPFASEDLYRQGCIFYAKANFGLAGEDAARWAASFEMLKKAYAMVDFGEGGIYG